MRVLDDNLTKLLVKADRLSYYIEKTAQNIESANKNNRDCEVLTGVLSVLRCEGEKPSHQDIFFLLKLFNNDARLNNLIFLKQNLENHLTKIRQDTEYLNIINFKCDEVVSDGTT